VFLHHFALRNNGELLLFLKNFIMRLESVSDPKADNPRIEDLGDFVVSGIVDLGYLPKRVAEVEDVKRIDLESESSTASEVEVLGQAEV
jgi:hypothetical protein